MSDTAVLEPASASPAAAPVSSPSPAPAAAPSPNAAPVSAVAEPWFKDWIKADGSLDSKALDRLPDHAKGLKTSWANLKTIDDLATTSVHQQFLVGKKALAPLPADAPAPVLAERKALMDSINGVPAAPKDYGIVKPADLPDAAWLPDMAEGFAKWAHENSVSPTAAKKLMALQMETVKTQLGKQAEYEQGFWTQEQANFDSLLKRENIPSDRANQLVEKGAIALGLDLTNERTKTFLKGTDARMMAMRHALAIGEDNFVQGDSKATESNPEELAKSAMHDKSNPLYEPYWNRDGKYPRDVAEAARAKVEGWLRQVSAKTPSRQRR